MWHCGDPTLPGSSSKTDTSGFNLELSTAEWDDLDSQIRDTIHALRVWKDSLHELVSWPGVEYVFCDFGTRKRREALSQRVYFPPELVQLAGELRIGLRLSMYSMQESRDVLS